MPCGLHSGTVQEERVDLKGREGVCTASGSCPSPYCRPLISESVLQVHIYESIKANEIKLKDDGGPAAAPAAAAAEPVAGSSGRVWLEGAGGGRLDEEMVAAVWGPVAAALSVVLESSRRVSVGV